MHQVMFRRAVLTIEGYIIYYLFQNPQSLIHTHSVKADYLFSYQPPINVVALIIMLPASYIMSPRWFHKASTANPYSMLY